MKPILENIKENNKLISEYMYPDWVHPKEQDENWKTSNKDVKPLKELAGDSYFVMAQLLMEDYEALKYHKSYDALMPVVKKIQYEEGKELKKESDAWIEYYGMEAIICEDIEMLYKSVVRFITAKNKGILTKKLN